MIQATLLWIPGAAQPVRRSRHAHTITCGGSTNFTLAIFGGGISALTPAYLYAGQCETLEKEDGFGGHYRMHEKGGLRYDEGGYSFFSWDENILCQKVQALVHRRPSSAAVRLMCAGVFIMMPMVGGPSGSRPAKGAIDSRLPDDDKG